MAQKTHGLETVQQVDAAIAALDVEVQEIEQWRESITREIAQAWDGDTSEQQADYVKAQARLDAAGHRRAMLDQRRRELRARQAIEDARQRAQEIADLERQRAQAQRQVENFRKALTEAQQAFDAIGTKLSFVQFWRRSWAQDEYPDLTEDQQAAALRAFAETLAAARKVDQQVA